MSSTYMADEKNPMGGFRSPPESKVEALARVFRDAEHAALAADPGEGLHNDGGSCNFDTPAFRIKGMREATIQAAAKLAGVDVTGFTWLGGGRWFWVNVTMRGQANRRSTMGYAAQKVLDAAKESGAFPGMASCFYQQAD